MAAALSSGPTFSAMERRFGSYAEYICLPEDWNLLPKPANTTHKQASAIPYGGFLALHCVKGVEPGQNVLVYGASGAIGKGVKEFSTGDKVFAYGSLRYVK